MANFLQLRSLPATISNGELRETLKKRSFYCKSYPWNQEYANDEGVFKNNFIDNLDGTVTDNHTGLMWQKAEAPDYMSWGKALPYIEQLNKGRFASHSDWRLPTIEELASLMTREKLNDDLYVSPVFSNKMWFWSCDKGGDDTGRKWTGSSFYWAINFNFGSLFCLETTNAQNIRAVRSVSTPAQKRVINNTIILRSEPKDFTNSDVSDVREVIKKYNFFCKGYEWNQDFCNDSGISQNDFVSNDDGTCIDLNTGLMWQKAHRPAYGRWEDALRYIQQLNKEHFAGYANWRLPTIEEYLSLLTPQKQENGIYINTLFSDRLWLWTADIKDASTGFIWNANILYGSIFWIDKGNGQDIRAVRTI
jgi:hypothetical protein